MLSQLRGNRLILLLVFNQEAGYYFINDDAAQGLSGKEKVQAIEWRAGRINTSRAAGTFSIFMSVEGFYGTNSY